MPHLDASALASDPDGLAALAEFLRPSAPPARRPRRMLRPVERPRAGPSARALTVARGLKPGTARPG
ncbi:hypothetical protein [Salinarimonas soli]|uniref:Uncharacterized protein n=1 Tax=Salinarimonas soli TaxID=1638099 RepID=A0A5B2V5P5_9HYPH|nr:hypothetical protein [Salinarimonas soli]KAA2234118.1 hypothetical protein F0L46_24410 [Salinarimonas soli]